MLSVDAAIAAEREAILAGDWRFCPSCRDDDVADVIMTGIYDANNGVPKPQPRTTGAHRCCISDATARLHEAVLLSPPQMPR